MTATLLIEIGTEELPPKALPRLAHAFATGLTDGLDKAAFAHGDVITYATPRRLAVSIADVDGHQPDRTEVRRGPAIKAAFDADGKPTRAALGFAQSCGVPIDQLDRIKTDQGEWLGIERSVTGQPLAALIGDLIGTALAALPIPKRMRWGAGEVEFVRPAHWIVVLHGEAVLPCTVLDLDSGRTTRGHRFHHGGTLELGSADTYAQTLEQDGSVIASFPERRARIEAQIAAAGGEIGGTAVIDPNLLDEVTALVELPVVIAGSFDEAFLALPEECLIASMQDHQKYFPVRDAGGRLTNRFVTISNINSRDPAVVRSGNERVIRPRLADAEFFYRTDRNVSLASRADALADMMFEKRLGSLKDKTERVTTLACSLAAACGATAELVGRAAALSRCDLLSAMVGEFPELQGTMGAYYAAADGEAEAVAAALGEFYQPRFAGDRIAASPTGRAIALADRFDTLVGIFGIGSAPTGDKDPYALRRAALGVIRTLIEGEIDLDLAATLATATASYAASKLLPDTEQQVAAFIQERMRGYFLERGARADVVNAVFAAAPGSPLDCAARVHAVTGFQATDAAAALAAANKRAANILRKHGEPVSTKWVREHLAENAEQALADMLAAARADTDPLFDKRDYVAYLERLAGLRAAVDAFFEDVMVMSDDPALKANRLSLLADLHQLFTRLADFALLLND